LHSARPSHSIFGLTGGTPANVLCNAFILEHRARNLGSKIDEEADSKERYSTRQRYPASFITATTGFASWWRSPPGAADA